MERNYLNSLYRMLSNRNLLLTLSVYNSSKRPEKGEISKEQAKIRELHNNMLFILSHADKGFPVLVY